VPELALRAAIVLDADAFGRIPPAVQVRTFERLPVDPEAAGRGERHFADLVVLAAAQVVHQLDTQARNALERAVGAMADGPVARRWRLVAWSSLCAAGSSHLLDDTRELLVQELDGDIAPVAFARFLEGIAARGAAELPAEAEALLAKAADRGADPVELVVFGLGRLALRGAEGAREAARACLLGLARRPPFVDDPRMEELVAFLAPEEGDG